MAKPTKTAAPKSSVASPPPMAVPVSTRVPIAVPSTRQRLLVSVTAFGRRIISNRWRKGFWASAGRRAAAWVITFFVAFLIPFIKEGLPFPFLEWARTVSDKGEFGDVLAATTGLLAFSVWNLIDTFLFRSQRFKSGLSKFAATAVLLAFVIFVGAALLKIGVLAADPKAGIAFAIWWTFIPSLIGLSLILELIIAANTND